MTPFVTPTREISADRVVCHCLRVSAGQIAAEIDAGTVETVRCVMKKTGAGRGCMACHCTIRQMLGGQTVVCDAEPQTIPLETPTQVVPTPATA